MHCSRGNARRRAWSNKILLLVPFHTFAIGYLALRTKLIGHIEDADDMELVTLNEAVSQKHSNTIRDELNALIASQEVPLPPMKVHDLRSTYTACVYHLYETDLPLNTVAQAVLGHEDLEESLSYAMQTFGCETLESLVVSGRSSISSLI